MHTFRCCHAFFACLTPWVIVQGWLRSIDTSQSVVYLQFKPPFQRQDTCNLIQHADLPHDAGVPE